MAEEEKDDWLEDLGDDGDSSGEIDQSDIDSLFSTGDPPAPPQEDASELDQADIDSLLSGGDEDLLAEAEAPPATTEDEGGDDEINQADIDALLSGESAASDEEIPDISPDQEEIDKLFSELDADQEEADPFQAEEIDFKDVIDESDEEDSFLSTGNEFADEEFDLDDDLLSIPDIPADEEETLLEATANDLSQTSGSGLAQENAHSEAAGAEAAAAGPAAKKFSMPEMTIPPALQERKNQVLAAGLLVLLLLISVFIFSGDQEPPKMAEQIPTQQQEANAPTEAEQPPEPPNTPPVVTGAEYQIKAEGPLAILLTAQDSEEDPLQYEILTPPEHGVLQGQAPHLIYLPNKNFPGVDVFNFRVTDGHNFSLPALVKITGNLEPETAQVPPPAPKKVAAIKPRQLIIAAKDFSYDIVGTKDFFIDWEKVWDGANYLPYTNQVGVEIISNNLQGKLQKISDNMHQYRAKKYSGDQEVIQYRFVLGKQQSKIRKITLNIDPGDPAPEIVLQPIGDFYLPGERVLLDATASMDENRESLLFSWQQISGSPVLLEVLNKEGSRVAFIAPSTFSTIKNPGPLMRLTATDRTGKKAVEDIKIATKSRHKSALWGSVASGRF